MKKIILLFFVFIALKTNAQTTARILDAQTNEPIPYANIQFNGTQSLISNTEGYFTLTEANSGDNVQVVISYIGYAAIQTTAGALKSNATVKLTPAMYELDEVKVKEQPSPESIMATVRQNLKQNYSNSKTSAETKIFMRESNAFTAKKMDVVIDKSTGFTKNNLKSFNAELAKFTSRAVSNPAKSYTDILFNYYLSAPKNMYKINVAKAAKLVDRSRSGSIDDLQGNAMDLFLKHLDTTKYYRIKSGWFGSRDTVTLRKDYVSNKKKKAEPKSELASLKTNLSSVLSENSLLSKEYEFIHDPKIYKYKTEGSVFLPDGNFAYVISFTPDRNRAVYKGKLYVTEGDFAVIRADYQLIEGKKTGGVNMKLLLGIKFAENLNNGTLIFKQRPSGEGYYLQYASKEEGQYMYLNRPLKFIELSDEDKDVVAFDLKIEGNMYQKTEYLNLARNEISESEFDEVKESGFKYAAIKQYDPKMWAADGAIEPLEEMKRFKSTDEVPQ